MNSTRSVRDPSLQLEINWSKVCSYPCAFSALETGTMLVDALDYSLFIGCYETSYVIQNQVSFNRGKTEMGHTNKQTRLHQTVL
jgi:hypothetical protein